MDFATADAKTLATTLSENPLDGRRLLIKDGDDFAGRPSTSTQPDATVEGAPKDNKLTGHSKTAQKILRSQKQPAGPTLFLGNLGFETTEQSIREMLESHRQKIETADPTELDDQAEQNKKWIRKIRMGTFEDSGKCKGWAFVDFTSIDHATAALTNKKNHFLDGRKLVVEYASPEAVRRGGGGPRKAKPAQQATGQHEEAATEKLHRERVRPVRKRAEEEDGEKSVKRRKVEGVNEEEGKVPTRATHDRRGRDRDSKMSRVRAKPGAALASAKREAVSIVPSQGKKIVF